MKLTEFLLERIAEDEQVARSALHHSRWVALTNDHGKNWSIPATAEVWTEPFNSLGTGPDTRIRIALVEPEPDGLNAPPMLYDARHIARHDPARVLAECEAKRRIVADREHLGTVPGHGHLRSHADWTLRQLSLPYADHPDYDESWRP